MSDLSLQKRLAAEILKVGVSRVRIDPTRIEDVESALTKEDIRKLIENGVIWAEQAKGNSRGRWKELHEKRKRGHRRGYGKRKGSRKSRSDTEEIYVYTARKLRRYLRWLRDEEVINRKTYRVLYSRVKGGMFRNLSDLKRHLTELGIKVR
ncbi:MAG: 50S ribosomal protein L19e [Zestosphaera sp.]